MAKAKHLTKEQILAAIAVTKSNKAASRYLDVSYSHYRKWARFYKTEEGKTLLEIHRNQSGKGIGKLNKHNKKQVLLKDIIEGKVPIDSYSPDSVKARLFQEGYLREECYVCGFKEKRELDYKAPLLIKFKDNNKKNWNLDNLEVLCYNHYFIYYGNVLSKIDESQIINSRPLRFTSENSNFELDDYHLERLRELGLEEKPKVIEPGEEYISRI